ncbi:Cleavage and polyadenylation specificity factor subunit 1 [Bonamia ostreae]|uniref:Cleavage and polyadenylation specificity factor subunit 1 n=1 Tax=Bonamia ostreae TaxID=126728 RepID=A0ABV2AS48_9EUKA
MLYYWNGTHLIGCAFLDLQFFSTRIVSLRNYLLVGDAYRCIYLLLWEPQTRQLLMMSRDASKQNVTSAEFLINKSSIAFFTSDGDRNLKILNYDPKNPKNRGGKSLEQIAHFRSGHFITKSVMLKAKKSEKKFFVLSGSVDGSFVVTVPLEEKIFRRLKSLGTIMTYYLEHNGGTNPRMFRKSVHDGHSNYQNFFIDGDLVDKYRHLDMYRQIELARKVKSSRKEILEKLRFIGELTRFS